ncbi:unnamed protein product [Fusarium equiseti]|uniref:NAD(P)-binding domain-containing protein n=1 Tax=Fusarium equiseti TaxID=61235 RepID=A0A8J2INN0_FUSEQ|nr:unnamed protein product [Fusarium equiseti]
MAPPLKNIAIVGGSGRVGAFITKALHQYNQVNLTVITRASSKVTDYPSPIKVIKVPDGYPQTEIVKAFRGKDAVILAVGFAGEHHLPSLARASVEAGVKRLIASGFGVDASNQAAAEVFPVAANKVAMIKDLKSLEQPGWSWTDVACGVFLDFCIQVGFFGINPANKKAEIWDDGNAKFTATTREAIGQAVVGILNHPEETHNRTVFISSTELSLNEILAEEQRLAGKDGWDISYVKTEDEIPRAREAAMTATEVMPRLMAVGRIGLAINMLDRIGDMSDPLGITASVIAVLQLAVTATKYLKDVKNGSADRLRLRDELRSTVCLVEMLKDRVEDIDDESETEETLQPASMKALVGPLSMFEQVLQDIVTKLEPQARLRRLVKPIPWPFDKKDISEMLACLERLKSHFNLIIQNDLHELAKLSNLKLDDLKDKVDAFENRVRNEEASKIISWISPISFRAKQDDILDSTEPGTGTWLLEHGTFQSWMRGDIDKLWCPGIPGAGKTSLISLIIRHMGDQARTADKTCLYVYCDYNRRAEQTTAALLSSLLQQVLQHSMHQPLSPEVSLLYSQHQRYGTRPTQAQVTELLRTLASSQATKLQISAQNDDIAKFREAQISQKYRLSRHVRADPKLKDDIIETIIKKSQGMWVTLPVFPFSFMGANWAGFYYQNFISNRSRTRSTVKRQAPEAVDLAEAVLF